MSRPILSSLAVLTLMSPFAAAQDVQLPFQKFVLENGLEVVIHEDHSDPVVAVYLNYHVGSGREETGRSGFAHLFEHLMFQGSKHVGDDQHFKIVSESGGTLNGSTNKDRTNYFETLPSNQLETALWLESDRMGYLLDSITQEKLDNQRDVVKNERRQNYENVPYAQANAAVMAALYPAGHPYSWLTIGSHEDLTAASLDDVRGFFRQWYAPNNATLCIGGDVDVEQALALARKWFGSLPRGADVPKPEPRPAVLRQTKRLVSEDKVQLPQLSLVWPTPPRESDEDGALTMLVAILSANKAAILDKALTIDEVLASRVSAGLDRGELGSDLDVTVRAAPGVSLDTLEQRVRGLIGKLAADGVDPGQLRRQQTRYEADFVNRLETVFSRTLALADANTFTGNPANVTRLLDQVMATTPAQVEAVLKKYVLGKPCIVMSVVPVGKLEMAASGRTADQATAEVALDRTARPVPAPVPAFRPPEVWHETLDNGLAVVGTRYTELPLVELSLSVPAGHLAESPAQVGLASLTASLMNEGTRELDTIAFADRLDALGADLSVRAGDEDASVTLRVLKKHLPEAARLMADVVLRPRMAQADFDRLKQQRLAALETRGDSIRTIAANAWDRVIWGRGDMRGWPVQGTVESVGALTLQDAEAFRRDHVVPRGAHLTVVGDLDARELREVIGELGSAWSGGPVPEVLAAQPPAREGVTVYLVDKPGAPQSEIRVGYPGLAATDPDYYPLSVMNYPLGGAFSGRINMNLREDKGYTYGARSGFGGGLLPGAFAVSAAVKTEVTKESLVEVMKELASIRDGLTEQETAFAKDSLTQAMNRQYESISALGGLLDNVARYGWADDYPAQRLAWIAQADKAQLDALATKWIDPTKVAILVVGDAATVREGLASLGYGPAVELDIDGNPLPQG